MDLPSDKELFDATEADETPEVVAETPAEQPAAEDQGQPRDDQGRFAPKAQDEPAPQPTPTTTPQAQPQAREEAHVPSWRLREVREEADRRLAEERANWQRQMEALQRQNQPKPEPVKPPEVWENPDGFVDHKLGERVDPIKHEVQETRNYYSHREALRDHGKEKVAAAFSALDQAARSGDRDAQDLCARVHAGMLDPWGEIMTWHGKASVYQQIGNDPNAWFDKELERRMADQQFSGAMLQKIQQSARAPQQPQGQTQPLVQLPPSLRNAPAARQPSNDDENGDISNDALWAHANR